MKRLDIIVEGQTEREFIIGILAPYLERENIIEAHAVNPIVVRTNFNSRGGMTKYSHLKKDIKNCLSSKNKEHVVSMMIDYFRKPSDLPAINPSVIPTVAHKSEVELIESAIANDIGDSRFIPYIQLHEIEAFLFTSKSGFRYCYGDDKRCDSLFKIVDKYNNPEDINTSPDGAPSKRMLAIIPEYNKVIDGNIIIMQNGINAILQKCSHFNRWIEKLKMKLR